jgi:hypothetical protein
MARSNNLSHRIDRLLNESSFRQGFSGSRRGLIAALIVPAVLVLAASLVRVQAAATPNQSDSPQAAKHSQDQPPSQSALVAQSNPVPAQASSSDIGQTPPAPPAPEAAPAPAAPNSNPAPEPPPAPPTMAFPAPGQLPAIPPIPPIDVEVHVPPMPPLMPFLQGFEGHASCFGNGDAYAIVGDPGTKTRFCGNSGGELEAEVEKARSVAHGHFQLFRHEGKFYVVDDPAIVSKIEDMNMDLQGQGDQMRAAAQALRDAGQQARDEARKATTDIPAPDLTKEMADLNAAVASLTAKQGATVSRQELAEVQREVSEIQRRLIESEVKVEVNFDMSKFNAEESKFNEQMSRMGAELGRTVQENQEKIRLIIDLSLKDGKARPVD